MTAVPERVEWGVELLDVGVGDHVVEIGGGNGLAAQLVLPRLGPAGRLTFIERSAVAIARASARNEDARFVAVESDISDVLVPAGSVDKVFAANVNVFWRGDAVRELEVISRALRPGGRLLLVYDAPSPGRLQEIGVRASTALTASGYAAHTVLSDDRSLLAVVAGRPQPTANSRSPSGVDG